MVFSSFGSSDEIQIHRLDKYDWVFLVDPVWGIFVWLLLTVWGIFIIILYF
jgi:hypothetical protein